MNILVIGSGGREHAITKAIAEDPDATIYAAVSNINPGIKRLAEEIKKLDIQSPDEVTEYAKEKDIDVAVIGPEAPLAEGVVDKLESNGVYGFGPKQKDARIETDKAWARSFMRDNDIDGTPEFQVFNDREEAAGYIQDVDGDVAVKPHGLTGGKGVRVTGDQISKDEAVEYVLNGPYSDFVIEERLVGEEFTLQAFVADGELRTMPAVQDHKRAYEGDEGPNTGGMGSYTDAGELLPFMRQDEYDQAVEIMQQTIDALSEYKGILYGQFMLTSSGPKVVEFNARFGDPEAMNVLPLMETRFTDVLEAARDGSLPVVSFKKRATVCKYAVPRGYPEDPEGGARVTVNEESIGDALLFYASVDENDGELYTTTSRSFAVVGIGDTLREAERIADDALDGVGEGLRVRSDVGKPELIQRRRENMNEIRGD